MGFCKRNNHKYYLDGEYIKCRDCDFEINRQKFIKMWNKLAEALKDSLLKIGNEINQVLGPLIEELSKLDLVEENAKEKTNDNHNRI